MKFYSNESDYDDALIEAARNTCNNCGEVVADLFRVHESATPYVVCSECYAEVDAILEREAAGDMQPADAGVLAAMRRKPAGRELGPHITVTQYLKANGFKFGAGGFVHKSGAWSVDTTGYCSVPRRKFGTAWMLCSVSDGRLQHVAEGNTVAELAQVFAEVA